MLKADGFNEAIIGMCHDIATGEERLIYDANICIDMLIEARHERRRSDRVF
jgi:hypothetical protein